MTHKDKIKIIDLYKEKQLIIIKDTQLFSSIKRNNW